MSCYSSPAPTDRFAVVAATHSKADPGPTVSFWRDMVTVVDLLTRHAHRECGHGISVWQRRGPRGPWKLITDTSRD